MKTKNGNYRYPEKWVSILFLVIFVLLVIAWLSMHFFGDQLKTWIIQNFEKYHLDSVLIIYFILIDASLLLFSMWLFFFGYKSISSQQIPPEKYFLLFKVRSEKGVKAIRGGLAYIIYSLVVLFFFCFMVYASYITYGGDI